MMTNQEPVPELKKVLFLLIGPSVIASVRVRVLEYLPRLQRELKIEPTIRCAGSALSATAHPFLAFILGLFVKRLRLLLIYYSCWFSKHFDLIFIHRILLPGFLVRRFKHLGKKIIFDFDDAVHIEGFYSAKTSRKRFENILRSTTHVVTSTRYNAEIVRANNPNTSIIISSVDPSRYACKASYRHASPIVLGWIGSPSTSRYLELIIRPLQQLSRRFPITLALVGANPRFKIPDVLVLHRPWILEREAQDLCAFDVGLMPLPDNEWTRAKGGYKLLQYMAAGLPVVASPVGVNVEIVSDGVNGYLAATEEEWIQKLTRLIEQPDLRERLGKAGRTIVESRYSSEIAYQELKKIFEKVSHS